MRMMMMAIAIVSLNQVSATAHAETWDCSCAGKSHLELKTAQAESKRACFEALGECRMDWGRTMRVAVEQDRERVMFPEFYEVLIDVAGKIAANEPEKKEGIGRKTFVNAVAKALSDKVGFRVDEEGVASCFQMVPTRRVGMKRTFYRNRPTVTEEDWIGETGSGQFLDARWTIISGLSDSFYFGVSFDPDREAFDPTPLAEMICAGTSVLTDYFTALELMRRDLPRFNHKLQNEIDWNLQAVSRYGDLAKLTYGIGVLRGELQKPEIRRLMQEIGRYGYDDDPVRFYIGRFDVFNHTMSASVRVDVELEPGQEAEFSQRFERHLRLGLSVLREMREHHTVRSRQLYGTPIRIGSQAIGGGDWDDTVFIHHFQGLSDASYEFLMENMSRLHDAARRKRVVITLGDEDEVSTIDPYRVYHYLRSDREDLVEKIKEILEI